MRSILLLGAAAVVFAPSGEAHTRIKPNGTVLKPRNDSSSLKSAPCGGIAVDESKRVELTAGDDLKVEWEETINHPGHFRIAFAPKDAAGFDANVLKDNIAHPDGLPAIDFNDPTTYHQFNATVKVPAANCSKCTIQVIQVMTDRSPPSNYYSCADVKIVGGTPEPVETPTASGSASASGSGTATASGSGTATTASGSTDTPTTTLPAGAVEPAATALPAAPTGLKLVIQAAGGGK